MLSVSSCFLMIVWFLVLFQLVLESGVVLLPYNNCLYLNKNNRIFGSVTSLEVQSFHFFALRVIGNVYIVYWIFKIIHWIIFVTVVTALNC